MELIEVFWFIAGAITMLIGFIAGSRSNDKGTDDITIKRVDEKQSVLDRNNVSILCDRDKSGSGDNGCPKQMDADEAKETLKVMRMSVRYSRTERDAIDYAVICIDIAHKLSDYWKGGRE